MVLFSGSWPSLINFETYRTKRANGGGPSRLWPPVLYRFFGRTCNEKAWASETLSNIWTIRRSRLSNSHVCEKADYMQSHGLHRLHPSQTNRVENVLRDASRPSAHLFSDRRVFISTISCAFSDLARMHGLPLLPGSPFCNHVRKENWSLYIGRKFWMSQTFLSFS